MARGRHRLARTEVLLEAALKRRLEARAQAEDRSIGELVRELLNAALEAREAGPGAVPKTRADHLAELMEESLKELRTLAILVGAVGRGVLANQQLLVHWATRDEGLGVNEDDLFAELQAAGGEAWQQVLDELCVLHKEPPRE
jgi:plasmid stability protein